MNRFLTGYFFRRQHNCEFSLVACSPDLSGLIPPRAELIMSTETENTPVVEAAAAETAAATPVEAPKSSTESYGEAFPALGGGAPVTPGKEVVWGGANQRIKRIKPTATTITLKIPQEERRFRPGQVEVIGKGNFSPLWRK